VRPPQGPARLQPMAVCAIDLDLKEPRRARLPGEELAGRVSVRVESALEGFLWIEQGWRAAGMEFEEGGPTMGQLLGKGKLQPEEEQSFDFSLLALPGPFTYRGRTLKLEWFLRARLEAEGGVAAQVEERFHLVPRRREEGDKPPSSPKSMISHPPRLESGARYFVIALGVLPLLLAALIPLGLRAGWLLAEPALGLSVAAVLLILGGGVSLGAWRRTRMSRALGPIEVQLSSGVLLPGDELRSVLRFTPREDIVLSRVSVWLRVLEELDTEGRGQQRVRSHVVMEDLNEIYETGHLPAGQEFETTASLALHRKVPYTYTGAGHRVRCVFAFELDVQGRSGWSGEYELFIVP